MRLKYSTAQTLKTYFRRRKARKQDKALYFSKEMGDRIVESVLQGDLCCTGADAMLSVDYPKGFGDAMYDVLCKPDGQAAVRQIWRAY